MIVRCVGVKHQFVVARVAQSGSDDTSVVLARLAVERDHHLTVGGVGVAHSVFILDYLHTVRQRSLFEMKFVSPRSVALGNMDVAAAYRQKS